MTIRAQDSQIIQAVIPVISVNMVDLQNRPAVESTLIITTLTTRVACCSNKQLPQLLKTRFRYWSIYISAKQRG